MADSIDVAVEDIYAKLIAILPPEATDEAFLRRAHVSITGQLPSSQEASQFLGDVTPNKRDLLIDRLVESPQAADHLFQNFAGMLRLRDEALGASQRPFHDWMRDSLRKNMPYDEMVHRMLTATGTLAADPAVGWLLAAEGRPVPAAVDTCHVWLGYDLQCAMCHDHPFADSTQKELYQITAYFAGLRTVQKTPDGKEHEFHGDGPSFASAVPAITEGRLVRLRLPSDYKYRDGNPMEPVKPVLPRLGGGGSSKTWEPASPYAPLKRTSEYPVPKDFQESLAHWVTVENADRFSHMIAGRLWVGMLGEGESFPLHATDLREPLDTPRLEDLVSLMDIGYSGTRRWQCLAGPTRRMRSVGTRGDSLEKEQLTHPVMLALATVMRNVSYDLREFQRVIWRTRVAQRQAMDPFDFGAIGRTKPTALADTSASPYLRRMSADQLWDALISLAGENTTEKKSSEMPLILPDGHPLRELGRSTHGWSDDSHASIGPAVARWMMHSPLVVAAASPGSRVMKEMNRASDPDARIRQAFLAILSRNPTTRELERARELYGSTEMDTPSVDSMLVWTLINTSEFLFLH
ncbi:uncharacterized protein DUF1549 [Roseimicrobium gellanilyticum]|uniref:Uncharacterized protein DUF1549 n=2 Tax=Roseimicrobium gellanilyticum TaxID=748857 RepID=A0A366HS61_9BACT|nr:uncharacterized protein DUF1549 [Roseimicrobium gellanilyticum]